MPANLTPAYKQAEAHYKRAKEPSDRLDALREMLKAIPKHKGTEHLQGDIKAKIRELTDEVSGPRKGGARTGPPTVIRPDGAGQVALIGPPNSGKSTLHARLTGSHAEAGAYPFTTQYPLPGMMPVHDVRLQLIDLPPIATEHPIPWISNALHPADGCLLVVDVAQPGVVERVVDLHRILEDRKVVLTGLWPVDADDSDEVELFTKRLPTLLIAAKTDHPEASREELAVLEELADLDYPYLAVSTQTGRGIDDLGAWLFDHLGVVRVYTKIPGKDPDMDAPYTVRPGATVEDVAVLVHRDIASGLQFARVWSDHGFAGQHVGRDHPVQDGDILELHA